MLGTAENPTASTLLFLEGLSREASSPVADAALLSLGIAAHKGKAREGNISHRIALSLRERLLASTNTHGTIKTLISGGNSGDREFLRSAATFLSASDPGVRSAAIFALRQVPFEEFRAEYERALSDREERVRESALRALNEQVRSPGLAEFLIRTFSMQTSSRMRVGVLNLLWSARKVSPDVHENVKDFVQGVASNPSLADVQRLASRLLLEGP